jgi:phage N-6-adenine-methyltransferase
MSIVLAPMTYEEARSCVDQIASHIQNARALVLDLYERRGWEALGYASWRECVTAEFQASQSHMYRQLAAALVEREISPMGEIGMIPERPLRELTRLDPDAQRDVWQLAVETAPNGKVTAAHVRAAARINEALQAAPEAVKDVVQRFGVGDADTIHELARLHKQRRDTFDEIAASGYVQPGDEFEAVHVGDGVLKVREAIQGKAHIHQLLAHDEQRSIDVGTGEIVPTRSYPLTASNHISSSEGYDGDEWYTPAEYIEAARRVMGGIDLDPASNDYANQVVRADRFFNKDDDGLQQEWRGRVFLNPPYSYPLIERFTSKLIGDFEAGSTCEAILLVNNSSDTDWFQALLARFIACFTDGRIRFYRDSGEYFGTRQGQAFFYAGPNRDRFVEEFSQYGVVVEAVR